MGITQKLFHSWDLQPPAAITLQRQLAEKVIRHKTFDTLTCVAGVDAGYEEGRARAAIVALRFPDMEILEYLTVERAVDYPYVPGLLSFREAPAILDGLEKFPCVPDVLIFDGHGIAHPRRLGIASHIGVLVDMPAIGCAKSRLIGRYAEPERDKGSFTLLYDDAEVIGAVVRTRSGVRPVFVSIGHRIDLSTAVNIVLACTRDYRLPEPTRWADKIAGGVYPLQLWTVDGRQ